MRVKIAAAALVIGLLCVDSSDSRELVASTDAQAIVAQQKEIRAQAMTGKGRFKDLDAAKLNELYAKQDIVFRLLDGKLVTNELQESEQIAVFNALESVQAIVNHAEDERLICERTRPIGSNRPKTVCLSVAERRANQDAARDERSTRNQLCVYDERGNCMH